MKPLFLLVIFVIISFGCTSQDINPYTCTFKGKKLYGKAKVVSSNADFKVKIVNSNEDISIIQTPGEPNECGEWKFVEYSEDFKIQIVTSGEDFTIRYTTGESRINASSSNEYKKEIDKTNCTFHGILLKGKVKVVTSFPDFKVKVVENFQDISVKAVTNFPDDCGEWQFVENFPDFTIQYVENFEDLKIKFVENFPGVK
jgi:hypothetical protein